MLQRLRNVVLILLLPIFHMANQTTIDSLKKVIATSNSNKEIAEAQYMFSVSLQYKDPKLALERAHIAARLSKSEEMDHVHGRSLNVIGTIEYQRGVWDSASKYFNLAISVLKGTQDSSALSDSYNNLGLTNHRIGNFSSALENHLQALRIREATNKRELLASSYHNIGWVYDDQGNKEAALEHYEKSLALKKELGLEELAANTIVNIGTIHNEMGEYDKALEAFLEAKDVYEETGDKLSYAIAMLNIADAYKNMEQYDQSKKYYVSVLKTLSEHHNQFIEAHAMAGLGTLHKKMKRYQTAINYLSKSIEQFRSMSSSSEMIVGYKELSECYDITQQYQKASEIKNKLIDLKDSLNKVNSQNAIAEMQTKYETTQKEKEIELLSANNEIQSLALEKEQFFRQIFISGIIVLVIIAVLLLRGFRIKQKNNQVLAEKNDIINKQNSDLAIQKQNIVDSINYAKRIQESILVDEEVIAQHLKDFFIYYEPRDIVSGDFYWFSNLGGKSIIAAVDCTGHGVPGAFMSMVGNSLLNEIVNMKGITRPSEILEQLHLGVFNDLQQHNDSTSAQDGMDLSLCCIDHENNTLEFAGAMNHLFMVRNGQIDTLKADLKHIGGRLLRKEEDKRTFNNQIIEVEKGDCFYLMSDGYTDQFGGEKRKKLGTKALKDILLKHHAKGMAEQKKIYASLMNEWKRNFIQMDDILMIGLRL
ncbi:MAG: tetratricopeptide repeat protein [Flavobacteriales bacterium]|nr:tetratricopeptide repeat protein [Flavobacteriales bacterium]